MAPIHYFAKQIKFSELFTLHVKYHSSCLLGHVVLFWCEIASQENPNRPHLPACGVASFFAGSGLD